MGREVDPKHSPPLTVPQSKSDHAQSLDHSQIGKSELQRKT